MSLLNNRAAIDRALKGATIILVLAAGWWVGALVWTWLGMGSVPQVDESGVGASLVGESASGAVDIDEQMVVDWHLFGRVQQKQTAPVVPQSAPKTRLNLRLVGAFVGGSPSSSTALIAASDGQAEVFRVEDSLPGGAKLKAIYEDRVLINHRGRDETLFFESAKQVLKEGPVRKSRGVSNRSKSAMGVVIAKATVDPEGFVSEAGIN